jgi:selenocysteine lyase/cysteine desulfurase
MHRRRFIASVSAGALGWPAAATALEKRLATLLPLEHAYWEAVREAFLIPEGRSYLNVGTLGVPPRIVMDAVVEHTRRVAMSFPPSLSWEELKGELGTLLNGDAEGFAFPRNTTEAMSTVANGLELQAGDEVLTTNHEHIGGLCCWQLLAARKGVRLQQLAIPATPEHADALVKPFRQALGPRTRVISVSHVNFTNGTIMPVRELVQLARPRGVIVVVDGAHPPGMMPVDLRSLDADFYAASPHKWLLAPPGTGLLYLREEWRTRLWPMIASGGWDDQSLGAHRLNHVGTADESRLAGLLAALRFHRAVGPARVYARIEELRGLLIDALDGVPGIELMTPVSEGRSAGMLSFRLPGRDPLELQQRLAAEANIRTRVVSEYDYGWMRLSPHIYTRPSELEQVAALIRKAAAG